MTEYAVPATGALILNDEDQIFLMKSPKWENQWLVPGGKVEKGDSMHETVRKEIKEETNLDLEDVKFMEAVDGGNPDDFERDTHFIFLNFVCRAATNEVELDQREAVEYVWIEPEKALEELKLNDGTADFIETYLEVNPDF
ncbi:MAG: NUDIX domain-containing protein [Nanohaloarchaea archaeon]|nr:NUDIX domain-containing protein [Candidatus Nanohaloarchaea archaeon]